MKNKLSKLMLVLSMAIAVIGLVITNSSNVFADGEKTINIHYLRDDKAYSDYVIAIWEDSNQGTDYSFTVSGNEGIATYKCSNPEATVVSFFIKKNDGTSDIDKNRTVDVDELSGTKDIYVKAGVEEISETPFESGGTTDTVVAGGQEQTKTIKSDDPNKDYSVSTVFVVIFDVIFLAIIAGIAYFVSSKNENK